MHIYMKHEVSSKEGRLLKNTRINGIVLQVFKKSFEVNLH